MGIETASDATYEELVTAVNALATARYNAGVKAADARVNTSSASYKNGYNNGVSAADNRANGNSSNYKTGYNNGYNAGYAVGLNTSNYTVVAGISASGPESNSDSTATQSFYLETGTYIVYVQNDNTETGSQYQGNINIAGCSVYPVSVNTTYAGGITGCYIISITSSTTITINGTLYGGSYHTSIANIKGSIIKI